jgi:hypothetical protein
MAIPIISPAGRTREDRQLWNTYLFWARSAAAPSTSRSGLVISKRVNRIRDSTARNLQAILFASFALEYRLKSIYELLGLQTRRRDTLGTLIQNFPHRVATARRLDGKGNVRLPPEWKSIEKRLKILCQWRNDIAHANYRDIRTILPSHTKKSRRQACNCFNAVVDTIRITNRAIGFAAASLREDRKYYRVLRIRLR